MFIKDKTKVACRMEVLSEELSSLESCCLRPMMRNSVLEELRVRRFADIQEKMFQRSLEVGDT